MTQLVYCFDFLLFNVVFASYGLFCFVFWIIFNTLFVEFPKSFETWLERDCLWEVFLSGHVSHTDTAIRQTTPEGLHLHS